MNQTSILIIIFAVVLTAAAALLVKSKPWQEYSLDTALLSPVPTSRPTAVPAPQINISLENFRYLNSKQIKDDGELVLESNDDPQAITGWYKEKIVNSGLNTTSFIQTNTNGQILNKLVGAGGGIQVRVEISKEANRPQTTIKVDKDG